MKGEMAEVCAKIIRTLNRNRMMRIGASQKRLRTFKKNQSSLMVEVLDMLYSYFRTAAGNVVSPTQPQNGDASNFSPSGPPFDPDDPCLSP